MSIPNEFMVSLGDDSLFLALRRGLRRERYWTETITHFLAARPLDASDEALLRAILFDPPKRAPLLMCNTVVRGASRWALLETMGDFFASDPRRKLYLFTAGGGRWARSLRDPSADLTALQRAVDKTLRRAGLSGILAFEFDIVRPDRDEGDYPLLWHVHGIVGRPDGREAGVRQLQCSFAASRAFPRWNGAPGLHIKPIRRTAHDLARVAAYLCDPVHQLKLRYPDPKQPGGRKMRGTRSHYPPGVILRGTELQSRIAVWDAVFGVGAMGAALRDNWRDKVRDALPLVDHEPYQISDALDEIWARVNATQPDLAFAPPTIITRSRAYASRRRQ